MDRIGVELIPFYQPLFETVLDIYKVDVAQFSEFYYFSDESDNETERVLVQVIGEFISNFKKDDYASPLVREYDSDQTEEYDGTWFRYLLYGNKDKFVGYDINKEYGIGGILIAIK